MIAFAVIAMAGIPLWRLTRGGKAVAASPTAGAVAAQIPLRLTFSIAPRSFAISHLGAVVWTEAAPGTDGAKTVPLAYPKEGVDLQVKVAWPADAGEAAVRVRLTDPDGNEHDKTVWGRGEMEEVVTFP